MEPINEAPVVIAETYLSLLKSDVAALVSAGMIPDEAQTRTHAEAFLALSQNGGLADLMTPDEPQDLLQAEGWYLGAGRAKDLQAQRAKPPLPAQLTPPRLRNDCFVMPQGVAWLAVDDALARLRAVLHPITGIETIPLSASPGRVLATDHLALRANPLLDLVDGLR